MSTNLEFKVLAKRILGRRVLGGPFAGMKYAGQSCSSTFMPKILGTYEREVAVEIAALIKTCSNTIVDVGCAEGYYANGSLYSNKSAQVVAFDTDPAAQRLCAQIAQRNRTSDRLTLYGLCDVHSLRRLSEQSLIDLLVMDVEGLEYELLNPVKVPTLATMPIVVEIHDIVRPGCGELIAERFHATHTIKTVQSRVPSWRDIESSPFRLIGRTSRSLERALVWERPEAAGMYWFIMTPLA